MTISLNYQGNNRAFPSEPDIQGKLGELSELKYNASLGGGIKRIESQHIKGKLTARERIALLLDAETFEEIGALVCSENSSSFDNGHYPGEAAVTGFGSINGEKVFVYAQDFTVLGGTISEASAKKICRVMDMAADCGCPVVGLLDSGGARIQDGVSSLAGCGEIFARNTKYSGVIPQISVIMGPCAGAAAYSPALTDFIFMVDGTGQMYITGPEVVRMATGENITAEESGGAKINATRSGNCHFMYETEEQCLMMLRRLLGFLPPNNRAAVKHSLSPLNDNLSDELLRLVPEDSNKPYDMLNIILNLVDNSDFMEVQEYFARNIIVGFARMNGKTVGIVAQQPMHLAGALTVDASDKAARFIRFCDCFNIPIITLVDVPGYMPGIEQEHQGIIRHGAKLLYAYAEATTAKISLVIRKAYGGAYIAMSSKTLKGDINFAWPSAEFAVMGPEGAINILYRHAVVNALSPEQTMQDLVREYRGKFANPYIAAAKGYIDDVIDPRETRSKLIKALEILSNKADTLPWKKHGNIPL